MIVVDTNVLAYLVLPGPRAAAAERLLREDAEWAAPLLWRSELRQVLSRYVRRGDMNLDAAAELWSCAEMVLGGRQHLVPTRLVLTLAAESRCSAYDCEYAALAQLLSVDLVTEDARLLAAFPEFARSLGST